MRAWININGEKEGDILLFRIRGWFNAQTYQQVENQLQEWLNAGERWLIGDVDGLDFISSIGLRVLLTMSNQLHERSGRLILSGLSASIRDVFNATGVSAQITIVTSKEEALLAVEAR